MQIHDCATPLSDLPYKYVFETKELEIYGIVVNAWNIAINFRYLWYAFIIAWK